MQTTTVEGAQTNTVEGQMQPKLSKAQSYMIPHILHPPQLCAATTTAHAIRNRKLGLRHSRQGYTHPHTRTHPVHLLAEGDVKAQLARQLTLELVTYEGSFHRTCSRWGVLDTRADRRTAGASSSAPLAASLQGTRSWTGAGICSPSIGMGGASRTACGSDSAAACGEVGTGDVSA